MPEKKSALETIKDLIRRVRGWFMKTSSPDNANALKRVENRITDILKAGEQNLKTARTTVTKAEDNGSTKYSTRREVLSLNNVDWMADDSSIKDQLEKHRDEINKMDTIVEVQYEGEDHKDLIKLIMGQVPELGGARMKRGNVIFDFDLEGTKNIVGHARTPELRAAALAAPYVAKKGILIAGQKNHEKTGATSLTYAAPVTINGEPVNVGVAIQFTNNGRPRAVNVAAENGGVFRINKTPQGLSSRTGRSQGTALPTRGVSNNKIASVVTPVKNNGERFSARVPIEYTEDLVALHNLNETKLSKALELGGFPMPSIAVTKSDIPHTNFGDISLVFGRDTIDPQADRRNTVYSADAWTPTFPSIEYEPDPKAERRLSDLYYKVYNKFGNDIARPFYDIGVTLESALNRNGGVEGLIEKYKDNPDMMNFYLATEKGAPVKTITKTTEERMPESTAKMAHTMMDILGEEKLKEISELGIGRMKWLHQDENAEFVEQSIYKMLTEDYGISEENARHLIDNNKIAQLYMDFIYPAIKVYKGNEVTTKTETDISGTHKAIRDAVDKKAYDKWLNDLFDGAVKNTGIYNNKDPYTASGNRRSFAQLHNPATLQGIVDAMRSQNGGNTKNVSGFVGVKTLRGGVAKRFSNIAEMHDMANRLKNLTQEEAAQINDALSDRLSAILGDISDASIYKHDNPFMEMDNIGGILEEIAEKPPYTNARISKVLTDYGYKISDATAQDIQELLYDIDQMPRYIFEAKPERAVGFDEVLAAVVPNNTDPKLIGKMKNAGIQNVLEYEADNTEDRLAKVNSVEGARFSTKTTEAETAYLAAVESGDMDTAQRMVDEAAKEAGYTIKAYHGTTEEFNKFSRAGWGKNHRGYLEFGSGFYFTPNEKEAQRWVERGWSGIYGNKSPKVMSAYLSAERLLKYDEAVPGGDAALKMMGLSQAEANFVSARAYRFINYLLEDKGFTNTEVQDELKALGFDAIDATYNNGKQGQYVVFDPEQIKSADPVTYDDNGNVIPLSERFNPANEDIRFSIKTEGLTDTQKAEIDYTAVTALNINNDKQDFLGQILRGEKTIETRATPIMVDGRPLAVGDRVGLVSTGRRNRGMLMGYATVRAIHEYNEDNFDRDYDRAENGRRYSHLVDSNSDYYIKPGKTKIGYEFEDVTPLAEPIPTSNDVSRPSGTRNLKYSIKIGDREVENLRDVMDVRQHKMFMEEIDNHDKSKYVQSADGDAIIPVDNMLVYTDFNKEDPGVSKIIVFDTDDYTDIDGATNLVYMSERGKISNEQSRYVIENYYGKRFFREYNNKDFGNNQRYDRQYERGKSRSDAYHAEQQQKRTRIHFEAGENGEVTETRSSLKGTENDILPTANPDTIFSRKTNLPQIDYDTAMQLQQMNKALREELWKKKEV